MFDTIISLLIPIVFVVIAIGNVLARARKAQSRQGDQDESEDVIYQATPDEIRRFLQTITGASAPPSPPPQQRPSAPAGMPQGTVTPTRRRSAGIAPGRPAWPPAPRPAQKPPAPEEETTRRLVPDDDRLVPAVESHLKGRRLESDRQSLDTSVESHVRSRHLAQSQHSLEPGIEAHLKEARLEGRPVAAARRTGGATGAVGARQTRAAGIRLPVLGQASLKQAIVLSEILAPPVGMRSPGSQGTLRE